MIIKRFVEISVACDVMAPASPAYSAQLPLQTTFRAAANWIFVDFSQDFPDFC